MTSGVKKIAMLTSGGDASGMNAAIRAITRYAKYKSLEIVGFYEGFKGLIENNFINLNSESVGGIIDRGGTILYSARSEEFKTEEGMQKAIANLKKNNIDGLIVIGGDGSFRGAHDLHIRGVKAVGIPGTIDNDIAGTDYSIGFDTALNVIISLISKIRDTAFSHDRIFVIEVMGRSSGMIAVHSGLACAADFVLIPEVPIDLVKVANKIKNHRPGKRHTIIVVAEGAAKAWDVASSIKLLVGHEVRVSVLGHLQRGGSPSAIDRVNASRLGHAAVEALLDDQKSVMVGIMNGEITLVPFRKAVKLHKDVNRDLITLAEILSV